MAILRNLTDDDTTKLTETFDRILQDNPYAEMELMGMEDLKKRLAKASEECDEQCSNKAIFEKLEALERQLKMIFDEHVLIDGAFKKIKILHKD